MKESSGKNIKKLIDRMKLTLLAFAEELNINRSMITLYVQGKRKPNLETCKKIIAVAKKHKIDINLDYLRPDLGINFNE